MQKALLVGAGGFLGSVARYLVTGLAQSWFGSLFPWGTATVNLLGSFLAGFIVTLGVETFPMSGNARLFLVVGVLGGFTTFSSFGYETVRLFQSGSYGLGALNAALNIILGLVAVVLGVAAARAW